MRGHLRGYVIAAAALGACVRGPGDPHEPARSGAERAAPHRQSPLLLSPRVRAAPASYRVAITMTAATANALAASGFALLGFKAVRSSDRAGTSLVWFRAQRYSLNTTVTWRASYQAYTAVRETGAAAAIEASASYDIAPGELLEVEHPTGTGAVRLGGTPGAISLHNQTTTPFDCGISQSQDGVAGPVAAFRLYGLNLQVIYPTERVLLVFSTAQLGPGAAVHDSPGLGLLVELEGAHDRAVSYDLNDGWRWGEQPWAQQVAPGTELAPLLIEPIP
jgi:hypothetical protein